MATSGKVQEAEKHIAEAEKSLKTGFLKWSPDYDVAANHYDKAAVCYRNARLHDKAKDAYLKAADAYYNNRAIYHSAKSLEQAAHVCRDAKKLSDAADLLHQACDRYNESGHPDTAGQVLLKAGQLLQHEEPAKAAKYYLMSSEYYLLDDKYREGANITKDAVRMYCRTRPRQLEKIVETSQHSRVACLNAKMVNIAHETIAVEIIALLLQKKTMQAREVLQEAESVPDFAASDDYAVLDSLIDAVTSNDEDGIKQACSSGVFRAMDPEFAKLVHDLQTGQESVAPPTTRAPKTKSSEGSNSVAMGVKPLTKQDPAVLADMRSQLLGTSKTDKTSSKAKKKQVVESSPPATPPPEPPSEKQPVDEVINEETLTRKDEAEEEITKDESDDEENPIDIN